MITAGLLLLLALQPVTPPTLEPGRTIDATLEPAAAWSISVLVDAPGPVTIEARSLAFDAVLELIDGAGNVVAQDDDGGIVRNARLVVDLAPDSNLVARVTAPAGRGGPFELAMASGDVPLPDGREAALHAIRQFEAIAAEFAAEGAVEPQAEMLLQAGEIHIKLGRTDEAHETFAAAARLDAPPMQARAEARLALLANCEGEYDAAIGHATRAATLSAACALPAFDVEAKLQLSLALEGLHDWSAAERALSEALAVTRVGDMDASRRLLLERRAKLLARLDEWEAARVNAEEWLTLAADEAEHAEALTRRAEADLQLGRAVEARAAFGEVLRAAEGQVEAMARFRATLGLAEAWSWLDDFPAAVALLEPLVEVETVAPGWRALAGQMLAVNLGRLGEFERAEALLADAVAVFHELGWGRDECEAAMNLSFVRQEAARREEAVQASETALERGREFGDDRLLAQCESMLAFSTFLIDDLPRAESLARSSLGRLRDHDLSKVRLLDLEILARCALRDGRPEAARDALVDAGRLLDAEEYRPADPADASRLRAGRRLWSWGEISQETAALEIATLAGGERDRAVTASFAENGAWKARALREAITDRPGAASASSLAELRATLADGDVVLDFANGLDRCLAFVVTPTSLDLVDLGPRADLERDVDRLVTLLARPRVADTAAIVDLSRALHRRLVAEPLAASADRPSRLLVSPVGLLARLPFEALVTSGPAEPTSFGDVTFLVEELPVVYVPSTPVFAAMARRPPREEPGALLLLADPLYCLEAGTESPRRDGPFERLVGTRNEARAILSGLGVDAPLRDRTTAIEEPWVEAFTGRAAAKHTLAQRADWRRYEVLHLAAHGVADDRNPRRTGLVLAGDELLSVEDVLRLELDLDVTVLSACDTGRGKRRGLDGAQSIALAFLTAGSRTVVSTLWMVDDAAAAELMATFHRERRVAGVSTAGALRAAQLRWLAGTATQASPPRRRGTAPVLEEPDAAPGTGRRHPFYWAAFVTTGAA